MESIIRDIKRDMTVNGEKITYTEEVINGISEGERVVIKLDAVKPQPEEAEQTIDIKQTVLSQLLNSKK